MQEPQISDISISEFQALVRVAHASAARLERSRSFRADFKLGPLPTSGRVTHGSSSSFALIRAESFFSGDGRDRRYETHPLMLSGATERH